MSIITWQFGYFPPAWAWAHCIAFSPHHAPHTTHCTALYCIIISFDASLRLQLLLSRCTSHVSCGPRPQARAVLLHLLPLGILWGCPTLRCFCAWDDTRDTGPRYGIYPWSLASASFHTKHQQPGRRIYSRHVLPSGQLVTGEVSLVLPSRTLASCKLHVLPHAAALLASPAPGPSPFPLPPPPHANPHRLAASPHLTLHHLRPICVNTPPPLLGLPACGNRRWALERGSDAWTTPPTSHPFGECPVRHAGFLSNNKMPTRLSHLRTRCGLLSALYGP